MTKAIACSLLVSALLGQSMRVVLRWRAVPGAAAYELQVAKDPSFTTVLLTRVVADAAFKWEEPVDGTNYWRVRSLDAEGRPSEWSEARTVNPRAAPPEAKSPADKAQLSCDFEPLTFELTPNEVFKEYVVELAADQKFEAGVREVRSSTPSLKASGVAPGTWWWRTKGVDVTGRTTVVSPAKSFTVRLLAPKLKGPDQVAIGTTVTLRWGDVPCASSWRVELQRELETVSLEAPGPSQSFKPPATGDYRWRVAALDARGITGDFSSEGVLRVRLMAPVALGEKPGALTELSWAAVPNAVSYRVEVSASDDFKALVQQATVPGLSFSGSLLPGAYRWRVLARDDKGRLSAPSETRAFEVVAPSLPTPERPLVSVVAQSVEATVAPIAGASSYRWRLSPLTPGDDIERSSAEPALHVDAVPSGSWRVQVISLGADGVSSAWSEPAAVDVAGPATVASAAVEPPKWRLGAAIGARINGGGIASFSPQVTAAYVPSWWRIDAKAGFYTASTTVSFDASTARAQLLPLAVGPGAGIDFGRWSLRGFFGFALQLCWAQVETDRLFVPLPGFEVSAAAGYALGPGRLELELGYLYGRLDQPIARLQAGGVGFFFGYAFAL